MIRDEGRHSQKAGMKAEALHEVQNASVSADSMQSFLTINGLGTST
jgi:hypothetical protein